MATHQKQVVLIRADANATIASGHIVRCISIATRLKKQGADCVFITADHEAASLIEGKGFSYICLETQWNNMEGELEKLLPLIDQLAPVAVLVDSYFVTPAYLACLTQRVQTIYMDDLGEQAYPVNAVVNYNLYAKQLPYNRLYSNSKAQVFLGTEYAPLREEYANIPRFKVKKQVENILITTGGSDPHNIMGRLLQQMECYPQLNKIPFHLVVGYYNPHYESLLKWASTRSHLKIHYNTNEMATLMKNADIAITAGGFSLYELCSCGVPSIFFTIAQNQQLASNAFSKNIMLFSGDYSKNPVLCVEHTIDMLQQLLEDARLREQLSATMQKLVDGQGTARIANLILENRKVR